MSFRIWRRKLKSRFLNVSERTQEKVPFLLVSLSVLVFVLLVFCVVQLTIVSVLSPRGIILMEYDSEKTALVEDNRLLEQRIAQRAALGVIESRAEKELDMDRVDSVMYLKAESVSAEVPNAK